MPYIDSFRKVRIFFLPILFSITNFLCAQQAKMIAPLGHTDVITDIAFSKDYKYVASASRDHTVKVWDMALGTLLKDITGHTDEVTSVAFSDDNRYLVSGSEDGTAKVWNLESGDLISTFSDGQYAVKNVEFFDGKDVIISFGFDRGAVLWDAKTGELIRRIYKSRSVYTDVSRDRKLIAIAPYDPLIRIIDVESGSVVHEFKKGGASLRRVRFSPDGNFLLAKNRSDKVFQWEVKSGKSTKVSKELEYLVTNRNLSPDENYQLYMTNDYGLHLTNIKTGVEIREFRKSVDEIKAMSLHPFDNQIVLASSDKTLKLWDIEKASAIRTFSGHTSYLRDVDFTTDGFGMLTTSLDKSVKLWDIKSGSESYSFQPGKYMVNVVAISPNGANAAIDDGKGGFSVISISDHKKLYPGFGSETNQVNAAVYSHDGKTLITGHHNNFVRIWDLATQNEVWAYNHGSILRSVDISTDGKLIASSGFAGMLKLMDRYNQQLIHQFKGHRGTVFSAKISPDGKYLLSGASDNTIKLWDISTKQLIWSGLHDNAVTEVNFGKHHGKTPFVVSCSEDGSFKLWELNTGREMTKTLYFTGSDNFITATPDNYYYASKDAAKDIFFTVGLVPYTFDQFDLQYNRPDIVLDRIGLASPELIRAYKGAYVKRLRKMGFPQAKIDKFVNGDFDKGFNVPEVVIEEQYRYIETEQKTYQFPVMLKTAGTKLDKLFISINGVPVYGVKGQALNYEGSESFIHQIKDLELSNGKNVITISVLNDNGVSSLKQTIEVVYKGAAVKPNLHIVTIGISKYKDSEMNLDYAAKDANDIAKLFTAQKDKYANINVYSFLDEIATTENILEVKKKLQQSKVDDQVVLFVAGHGLLDDNLDYFIATHDVDFVAPAAKGLKYEELEGLLDEIPARNKLMMIDACHSGEVDKEETVLIASTLSTTTGVKSRGFKNKSPQKMGLTESFELMQKLFNDLRAGNGSVVISAASGVEFSLESNEWSNGVFTYSLLEALKTAKADGDANQKVNVSELQDYVFKRVDELTNGKQHPTSRRENLENDFVVW